MSYMASCNWYGKICHTWRHVTGMERYVIHGVMYGNWYGKICHTWLHVTGMERYVIHGVT